jgi:Photosynthesis system II assembly factor YCF48/Putative zinc-finger
MNHELPKPMLDALAREAIPTSHPTPDVLTAFLEHALSGGEKHRVTDHLARCAECREVVFLASNAAEEPVAKEQDWLADSAVPRISPALVAKTHAPASAAGAAGAKSPRNLWAPRTVWALPVAAVVLLVAGLWVERRFVAVRPAPELALRVTTTAPTPPLTKPGPEPMRPSSVQLAPPESNRQTQSRTSRIKSVPPKNVGTLAEGSMPAQAADKNFTAPKVPSTKATGGPAEIAISGAALTIAPATPHANSFAANQAQGAAAQSDATSQSLLASQPSTQAVSVMSPRWRATNEGHLEHLERSGWTRVLSDQTTKFRAVSVIGNDVWAGGHDGELFHSSDGGQKWKEVYLVTAHGTETGTIVSIHFDDPQHGVVITESGLPYSTSDGGMSWSRD